MKLQSTETRFIEVGDIVEYSLLFHTFPYSLVIGSFKELTSEEFNQLTEKQLPLRKRMNLQPFEVAICLERVKYVIKYYL